MISLVCDGCGREIAAASQPWPSQWWLSGRSRRHRAGSPSPNTTTGRIRLECKPCGRNVQTSVAAMTGLLDQAADHDLTVIRLATVDSYLAAAAAERRRRQTRPHTE